MRGSILKEFGWTYDYLLWGISWIIVKTMIADQAKIVDDDDKKEKGGANVVERRLDTKEDIINYLKGQL